MKLELWYYKLNGQEQRGNYWEKKQKNYETKKF